MRFRADAIFIGGSWAAYNLVWRITSAKDQCRRSCTVKPGATVPLAERGDKITFLRITSPQFDKEFANGEVLIAAADDESEEAERKDGMVERSVCNLLPPAVVSRRGLKVATWNRSIFPRRRFNV
jgi:hypothetical protein